MQFPWNVKTEILKRMHNQKFPYFVIFMKLEQRNRKQFLVFRYNELSTFWQLHKKEFSTLLQYQDKHIMNTNLPKLINKRETCSFYDTSLPLDLSY